MSATGRPVFVEADNAMGSSRGDVDDGFALGALLQNGASLTGIGSVFGNTSEAEADRNNRALTAVVGGLEGRSVPHLRGARRRGDRTAESVDFLVAAERPFTLLALGPLTTVAATLAARPGVRIAELVIVGGDATSRGRWPPLWPYEFNLRLDRAAACRVFASELPITIVPLDVGRRLLLSEAQLDSIPGSFGEHARQCSRRWFRRARRLFRGDGIRVYALLATAHVLRPDALRVAEGRARMHRRGWLEFGRGRPVRIVRDFDSRVLQLLTAPVPLVSAPDAIRHTTIKP